MKEDTFLLKTELELIAKSLKRLQDNGVIRTKNLVGDLGEYYCKELLDLKLDDNVVNKGFDAKDKEGNKVEIKTRRMPSNNSKIIFRSFDFDYCLFVELDIVFMPISILKIDVNEICNIIDSDGQRMSVNKIRKTKHVKIK